MSERVKKFMNDFSFWKFLLTMIIFAVLFVFQLDRRMESMETLIQSHIKNAYTHTSDAEKFVLQSLATTGMGANAMIKIIELDKRISALELEWKIAKEQGRLQTPAEKEAMMKRILNEQFKK